MGNEHLKNALKVKNDEFYTRIADVESELANYTEELRGKRIFLNCDSPQSAFLEWFRKNYARLELTSLVAIGRGPDGKWFRSTLTDSIEISAGDFRSTESLSVLKEADIVVTNPPFSLFREYVSTMVKYDKKFLIVGPCFALGYKEIFSLIKENKLWLGMNLIKAFSTPQGTIKKFGRTLWFTNVYNKKRHEYLLKNITMEYKGNENKYPIYDNFNAIEVSKVANIPMDYFSEMGVPITFLIHYNPEEFELLNVQNHLVLNGKGKFKRIIIKRK